MACDTTLDAAEVSLRGFRLKDATAQLAESARLLPDVAADAASNQRECRLLELSMLRDLKAGDATAGAASAEKLLWRFPTTARTGTGAANVACVFALAGEYKRASQILEKCCRPGRDATAEETAAWQQQGLPWLAQCYLRSGKQKAALRLAQAAVRAAPVTRRGSASAGDHVVALKARTLLVVVALDGKACAAVLSGAVRRLGASVALAAAELSRDDPTLAFARALHVAAEQGARRQVGTSPSRRAVLEAASSGLSTEGQAAGVSARIFAFLATSHVAK